MPALGENPANRWQGSFPYADNFRIVDPASGLLGNTNNKTFAAPFPRHQTFEWGDTHRIQRWLALMATRDVHTRESFIEAQLDTVSPTARALLPLIGPNSGSQGTRPRRHARTLPPARAGASGRMERRDERTPPRTADHRSMARALQDRLIRDELGPLADEYTHVDPVFVERVFTNTAAPPSGAT